MNTETLLLYLPVFGLWLYFIKQEGGVGVGVRYLYVVHTSSQLLLGPAAYWAFQYPEDVDSAAVVSLLGLSCFLMGAYVAAPIWSQLRSRQLLLAWRHFGARIDLEGHYRFSLGLIGLGLACQAVVPMALPIPTVSALTTQASLLAFSGSYLLDINGRCSRKRARRRSGLAALIFVSLYSAIASGFAGLGPMVLFLAVSTAWLNRLPVVRGFVRIGGAVLVGLVCYQVWMAGRGALREQVAQDAGFGERVATFVQNAAQADISAVFSSEIADRINYRLDQSPTLAAALQHTPAVEPYAEGATLLQGLYALIPRYLWPDKPMLAGGQEFISKYTGIQFHPSIQISVGMHMILEFYVNFGLLGVAIGLFCVGVLTGLLDYAFLLRGSSNFLVQVFVLQIAWALVLSNVITEFAMSAGAGAGVAWSVSRVFLALQRRGYIKTSPAKVTPRQALNRASLPPRAEIWARDKSRPR